MDRETPIRVLCVDDHPVVREGLRALLGAHGDINVIATAGSGEEAVQLFREHRPDVTVLDLRLPGMNGVQALELIRRDFPHARVIVLTTYEGDEDIYRALQSGAATYLLKDTVSDQLVQTVRAVHSGERPIPERVASSLVNRLGRAPLTGREVEVLRLVAKGCRNKEIAGELGITEETAQVHVRNILAKLDVHDRTEAVTLALRRGILHLD